MRWSIKPFGYALHGRECVYALLSSIIAYTPLSPHYSISSFEEDDGHHHAIPYVSGKSELQ